MVSGAVSQAVQTKEKETILKIVKTKRKEKTKKREYPDSTKRKCRFEKRKFGDLERPK